MMAPLFRGRGRRRANADAPLSSRQDACGWLKLPRGSGQDVAVKPATYLPVYEELLAPLRGTPAKILELGVWKGDSLVMWRDALPGATIIGLDLFPPAIDLGPHVHVVTGDQTDEALLSNLRAQHAAGGFDVIIDDASHIGQLSARSLQALYTAHLRPGGLYIIEDWGTGYVAQWPDGADLDQPVSAGNLDRTTETTLSTANGGTHLPSHDAGMVGLIKRLVDHTARTTLSVHQPDRLIAPLDIEWLRLHDGLAILKKPG